MKALKAFFGEHQGTLLRLTLAATMVLFIGILIVVYFLAKQANPVFLDEKGQPVQSQSGSRGY